MEYCPACKTLVAEQVIRYNLNLLLSEEAEMLQDIRDYDAIKMAIEREEEELIPSEVVFAILDGENPIKVWRRYCRLSQSQLASSVGICVSFLSQLETGKRAGTTDVLIAIARALQVGLDDLVVNISE